MSDYAPDTDKRLPWNVFDRKNFQAWKRELVIWLQDKKCYKVVLEGVDEDIPVMESSESSGSDTEGDDEETKKEKKNQRRRRRKMQKSSRAPMKDFKAKAIITASMNAGMKQRTCHASPAKEMWDILQQEYQSCDYVSIGMTMKRLYSMEYAAGTSMETEMKERAWRLR